MSAKTQLTVGNPHLMADIIGLRDQYVRIVEQAFEDIEVFVRGNVVTFSGASASLGLAVFQELQFLAESGSVVDEDVVRRTIAMVRSDVEPRAVHTTDVLKVNKSRTVRPKTAGQKTYVDAINDNIITFGIGPAGTGKSYLAVAQAVQALHAKAVQRIILTRPAVEAGERLGFLPGDLMAKVDPYLRPLYDALYDMLEAEPAAKLFEKGAIEVAPLAFMRGRTLNNSFIILDEAQNTTPEQMKMFLTRIGFGSKAVITGDRTQVDLDGRRSGLTGLRDVLEGIESLSWVELDHTDVVRHRIVADIVAAYERIERN